MKKKEPHIKKPLNAFMLYMKEMRPVVQAECTLKESAAINQILGRRVKLHHILRLLLNFGDIINFTQGLGQLKHLAMDIGSPGLCIQTKATSLNWFVIIPIPSQWPGFQTPI